MAKHIRNMKELNKALQPIMMGMVDKMAERVYDTMNYFLQEYYDSYDPVYYHRLQDFLRSAVKVDAHPYKGGVRASVYIMAVLKKEFINRMAENGGITKKGCKTGT